MVVLIWLTGQDFPFKKETVVIDAVYLKHIFGCLQILYI